MLAVPGRHRSLALLACVLVAQVLLLAVQIRRDTQRVRLIRVWAVGAVTPFERAGTWSITKVRDTWNGYFALVHTHRDDLAMKAEMDRLKIQNEELQGQSAEAQRLAAMLGFINAHTEVPMVAARVFAASADSTSHTFYINRGEHEGIRRDMAVITADGVVGKVLYVYGHVSNVLEITDRDSGVGALLADSRIQGPVGGTGEPLMVMKYVSNDDDVKVGQQILTSGQDQIFPKDLPVGTITEVKPGSPFKLIRVKPAAHLDQLEEVMVLLTRQELITKPAAAPASTTPDVPAPTTSPAKR
ncbi:MAG TPA: rod shape-determining protein MreC [Candidatus Acidoferrales bacterium]|jgi:rod shape-determining protein MreC